MSGTMRVLAATVLGPERLGPEGCPILLELVEVDTEGARLACASYRIDAYRIDEPEAVPGGWPFTATAQEGVASVRERVRIRWMEATLQELPADVFEDGAGVSA